jgi:hypothetical protein
MARIKLFIWYVGVLVLSVCANITIKFIPFKSLIRWITNSEAISTEELRLTSNEQKRLYRAEEILEHVREKVPWRVFCFEQAIVALIMAKVFNVNMNIYFGVQKVNDQILAHAWTVAGEEIFTGKEESANFVPVFIRGYKANIKKRRKAHKKEKFT